MNYPVIFALGSMFCAGVNDFIFKRYVSKSRLNGIYLSLTGVIWALVFYTASLFSDGLKFNSNTVIYGLICGFFSIVAQVFLLEGLRETDATIGSTIYRLNFVVVIILAPLFLRESLTMFKLGGGLLAIGSALFLSKNNQEQKKHHIYKLSFLFLVIVASILRGLMGFFYKVAINHNVANNTFLLVNACSWILGGLIYASFFERGTFISRKIIIYSGISGFLVAGIVLFLLLAVKGGEAIIAVPISQLSFIITSILAVLFLKEEVTMARITGIFFAVGAIFCLSR
ncbi:MAG: EamA family transporter [Candidatus Omnitrophota bacterium]